MKVYVVFEADIPDCYIRGVFSTRAAADEFLGGGGDGFWIEEHGLDDTGGKRVQPFWHVAINLKTGADVSKEMGYDQAAYRPGPVLGPIGGVTVNGPHFYHAPVNSRCLVVASAVSLAHAWEVAVEKRQEYLELAGEGA